MELYRELLGALYRNVTAPALELGTARWEQPTNDRRDGRLLIVPVAFAADITDEPFTFLPFSSVGVPGSSVQIDVDMVLISTDGQGSTDQGTFVADISPPT